MKKFLAILALAALLVAPAFAADNPQRTIHATTYALMPACDASTDGLLVVVNDADYDYGLGNGSGTETVLAMCQDASWVVLTFYGAALVDATAANLGYVRLDGALTAPPAACAAGTKGTIYFDVDINKLCICNGTNYVLANDATTTTGCS